MKRMIVLLLCLCVMLGGCAQGGTTQYTENDGGDTPDPAPITAESFEKLALALAEMPELPEEPDETALWERMNGKSAEEQSKLWDEFSAQQTAYYEAVRSLRGEGVDESLTPAFLNYTLRTARQLLGDAAEENIVYSPANLYLALCMLAETADGESRAQVLDLLGLESAEQARGAANALWRNLYRDGSTGKTLLANSIWLNEQVSFHEDVVDTLADSYYASTFRAAMGDRATDKAIFDWINANTNDLLSEAAGALKTDPDTLMMLISTLYFKGTWSDQFGTYNTSEGTFAAANGDEQKIDFMHKTENGAYYRDALGDGFTAASLPFRDGTAMWFLLPDEGAALDAEGLLSRLTNYATGTDISDYGIAYGYGEIHWSVPKFDVSSALDLIPALEALGVTDIFADGADFSPLTDLDAVVSAVKHAARVKVDEEGCEAAAFTAITMDPSAAPETLPVVEMNLNRPFGFLVTGADGLPLFLGVVNTIE